MISFACAWRWLLVCSPTVEQHALLEKAGQLDALSEHEPVAIRGNAARLRLVLSRQAVSLIVLEW
jgi:hypothetical protein